MRNEAPANTVFVVRFLDVGQGDAAVVELPDGRLFVIDSNRPPHMTMPPLQEYLEDREQRTGLCDIDLLCLTHPDRDHYRGLVEAIDWVTAHGGAVRALVRYPGSHKELAGRIRTKQTELSLLERTNEKRRRAVAFKTYWHEFEELIDRLATIRTSLKTGGRTFWSTGTRCLGNWGSVQTYLLWPTELVADEHRDTMWDQVIDAWLAEDDFSRVSANDLSCVLWVTSGVGGVLLTGDASHQAIVESVKSYSELRASHWPPQVECDVVKAPHHGSASGSSPEMWSHLFRPGGGTRHVVFSAGTNAKYRHPRPEVIQHLADHSAAVTVYCTNICLERAASLEQPAHRLTVEEAHVLEDDTVPAGRIAGRRRATCRPCHGECAFEFDDEGSVFARPQRDEGLCWQLHGDGLGVCFAR